MSIQGPIMLTMQKKDLSLFLSSKLKWSLNFCNLKMKLPSFKVTPMLFLLQEDSSIVESSLFWEEISECAAVHTPYVMDMCDSVLS